MEKKMKKKWKKQKKEKRNKWTKEVTIPPKFILSFIHSIKQSNFLGNE
jgi:hypothetical protein